MINKLRLLVSFVIFTVLSVGILLAGLFLAMILSFVIPLLMIFTGLWGAWAVWKDHFKDPASDFGSKKDTD